MLSGRRTKEKIHTTQFQLCESLGNESTVTESTLGGYSGERRRETGG